MPPVRSGTQVLSPAVRVREAYGTFLHTHYVAFVGQDERDDDILAAYLFGSRGAWETRDTCDWETWDTCDWETRDTCDWETRRVRPPRRRLRKCVLEPADVLLVAHEERRPLVE